METEAEQSDHVTAGIDTKVRAGGAVLAIGSLAFVVGMVFHPPPSPDPAEFMATIAADPTRWIVAHWGAAIGLSAFAIAGLIMLTAGSRLTQHWWTVTAWAALVVSSLWITTAAVAEATVITYAAIASDTATFEAWQSVAEAYSTGFVILVAALTIIAVNEARSAYDVTPTWVSWLGALAGIVAFAGFTAGFGLGIALGGLVWVISTIVLSLWLLWFGVALTRSEGAEIQPEDVGKRRPKPA